MWMVPNIPIKRCGKSDAFSRALSKAITYTYACEQYKGGSANTISNTAEDHSPQLHHLGFGSEKNHDHIRELAGSC